jgi:hypothetical protein
LPIENSTNAWADPWVALDKTGVPAHGHSGAVKAALIADHIVLRYNVRVTGGYEVIETKTLLMPLTVFT